MINNILIELMDSIRMSGSDIEYTVARVEIYKDARFIVEFIDKTFTSVKLYGFDLSRISKDFNSYRSSDESIFDNVPIEFVKEHLDKIHFEYKIINI